MRGPARVRSVFTIAIIISWLILNYVSRPLQNNIASHHRSQCMATLCGQMLMNPYIDMKLRHLSVGYLNRGSPSPNILPSEEGILFVAQMHNGLCLVNNSFGGKTFQAMARCLKVQNRQRLSPNNKALILMSSSNFVLNGRYFVSMCNGWHPHMKMQVTRCTFICILCRFSIFSWSW